MNKRLYRDTSNKMIFGVLSGIADYLNMDPTIVRLIYVLISALSAGFPGILIYIIMAVITPEKPYTQQ